MDHKDLGTSVQGSKSVVDGSTKIAFRNKTYDVEANSLVKVDAPTSRPCAIIGPDRVLPPNSNEGYLKKTLGEPWTSSDNVYRRPPEYPNKISDYEPTRNISPRQTFQENMQRIMVPPTFSSMKNSEESSLKNTKTNMPQEVKYCDVPYSVTNSVTNEHKNVRNPDIPMSTVNPAFTRNIPPPYGWPASVNVRQLRPYGAPDFHQYTEFPSCAGPRPMSMIRPHRSLHEESAQAFSDRLYQDANIRFKPYPTGKEQHPQARYDYISNYPNTFHPPTAFPPHKYDIQKTMHGHPYSVYPQVPLKYLDRRIHEPYIDGYHRSPNQQINFNTFHNQIVPPPYGPIPGNCGQSKSYPEIHQISKNMTINKIQYENNNKVYLNLDSSRTKSYPLPDNYFYNDINHPMRSDVLLPTHPVSNIHPATQHPIYRKDNTSLKSYEYNQHFRNFDPSVNLNHPLSKVPLQFSPNSIAISPSDSNTSNDTVHTLGAMQEDCGYVSQSSTTSARSLDSLHIPIPHDIYRRHNYNNYGIVRNTFHNNESEQHVKNKNSSVNKKSLNVRQFLQMWNEGDDEVNESNKEPAVQNHGYKYSNSNEGIKNQEQLYVLGLVNVPTEELDKYNHIQKISKLPENIKGYNNIEILNQYEQLLETPLLNNYNKLTTPRDYKSYSKNEKDMSSRIPRPISPLDVEAKISQSVIHKEVGCNFEIKPCSPEILNAEIAAPVQTLLNERMIEKVINPIITTPPILSKHENNNLQSQSINNETNKITSCKLISNQYMPDSPSNKLKTNSYMMQDLESNSGVCLASLPQLDNDIELNFPEINQQFIKANKMETNSASNLHDLPQLDIEKNSLSQEIDTSFSANPMFSQTHSHSSADKEFCKLSKYRKSKKMDLADKQDAFKSNDSSTQQRIDSVIIKNPDNTKMQDNISSVLNIKIQQVEQPLRSYEDNLLSQATAIDFSFNRCEAEIKTITANCLKSPAKENNNEDTISEQITENKPNNITSFINSADEILSECSQPLPPKDKHQVENNQIESKINIQTESLTVNIFNEENNVPVIRKVGVCNLETVFESQVGDSETTDSEISASDVVSKKPCREVNATSNSNSLLVSSKEECPPDCYAITTNEVNIKKIDNDHLVSSDGELQEKATDSELNLENEVDSGLSSAKNVCENNNVQQSSFNICEILSIVTDENTSSIDLSTNNATKVNCIDLDIKQIAKEDRKVEKLSGSSDNTTNIIEISHDVKESDECKSSVTPNRLDTENVVSSLHELENQNLQKSNITTLSMNDLINLKNVSGVDEKTMCTSKFETERMEEMLNCELSSINALHEEITTHVLTSTYESCNSKLCISPEILDSKQVINKEFYELKQKSETNENKINSSSEKCNIKVENETCSFLINTGQSQDSVMESTIIDQEESITMAAESVPQHQDTGGSDTNELRIVLDKSNIPNLNIKNEGSLPILMDEKCNSDEVIDNNQSEVNHILCDKSDGNIILEESEMCLSSINDLRSTNSTIILKNEECELVPNSFNMNVEVQAPVTLVDEECNVNTTVEVCPSEIKSTKFLNVNSNSYHSSTTASNNDGKNVLKKHNKCMRKELYSPWIQKLLTYTEGFYKMFTFVDNLSDRNIFKDINEPPLSNNYEIKQNDKCNLPLLQEVDKKCVDAQNENTDVSTDKVESLASDSIALDTSIISDEFSVEGQDIENYKEQEIINKVIDSRAFVTQRKVLKRSLSESALEEYKCNEESKALHPSKRNKPNPTIIQSHVITEDICNILQTNRRKSISTFYNEENVYIVIDNDLILSDEDSEKLCYTQVTDQYTTSIESTLDDLNPNLADDFSTVESTKDCEFSDGLQKEEHVSSETWMEDVGCVETVFSEDVAENITIDNQMSPKKNDSLDLEVENDEMPGFYDSEHMDKIKNIYGSTMCNDDTQLIETLYKTPQMDVNKTLNYIECHNPEEYLQNLDGNTVDEAYLELNNENKLHADLNHISSLQELDKENMSKNSTFTVKKCEQDDEDDSKYYDDNYVELRIERLESEKCEENDEYMVPSGLEDKISYSYSSSPEVSSTTSEEKNSSILLKITNCNGSRISEVNEISSDKVNRLSYKLTEKGEYRNYTTNFSSSRTLITKAAQKYIPPLKDLKVKLHLPQHRLNTLKQLKLVKTESKVNTATMNSSTKNLKPDLYKKKKPKFEDVLKSIDEINFRRHKDQSKKAKNSIPKVIIKKNENGAHYASNKTQNSEDYNPDLTGRKWQPWVFLEKDNFIDRMVLKNKAKAVYCHRKKCFVLADKFRKYKSVYNANFIISQPKLNCSSKGNLKYTIRLKHN